MLRQTLNKHWIFTANPVISVQSLAHTACQEGSPVDLPHDAMIHETRTPDAKSKNQSGFYPGGSYCYTKKLFVPDAWKQQRVALEFEGIYKNARVYINGQLACAWQNGYTEVVTEIDDYLNYDCENEIRVFVSNTSQPSSRWYSGSGIYRGVNLLRGGLTHIGTRGVQVKTVYLDQEMAQLNVSIPIVNASAQAVRMELLISIYDREGREVSRDALPMMMYGSTSETLERLMTIHRPAVWDCGHPNLYRYCVKLVSGEAQLDAENGRFGVRTLAADSERGLLLNGKPVKLRGACIHHDNGILGACAYADAEQRRIRILKEAGFNCIRSAHNPLSRAMLDACDEQGMLVMDEYADMWTVAKNEFDDAAHFPDSWKKDLSSLVRKDFNHPSVILYCLGNEIPEAGTERGAWLCRRMDTEIKSLDTSRLTTTSVSGTLSCSSRLREIIAQIAERFQGQGKSEKGQSGMDAVSQANSFASLLHGPLGDAIWQHPTVTEMLEGYKNATDITGLNYMPARYPLEKQQHPDRLVLGTEEYPADIQRLWSLVEENPHVIGDMTWTGYDYIGEAGIGIFYYDGTVNFMPHWPDRLAYIGDIDINGNRRSISYYREIVYGLRKQPYIAVKRMEHNGETPNQTAWMFKDNISSWTWHGCEGMGASVDVYCDAQEVELVLNGKSLGIRGCGRENHFTAEYTVPYQAGKLAAYAIRGGKRAEAYFLETADASVMPVPEPEKTALKAGSGELLFIPITLRDSSGRLNPQEKQQLTVCVEGAAVLKAFGSANPSTEEAYDGTQCETYDGRAMAVVGAADVPGTATIRILCGNGTRAEITVTVDSAEK